MDPVSMADLVDPHCWTELNSSACEYRPLIIGCCIGHHIGLLSFAMSEYPEKRANLAKIKEHLSAYVADIEAGESILICRHNRPVAKLVPVNEGQDENRTRLGSDPGSVSVHSDLTDPAMGASEWAMHR